MINFSSTAKDEIRRIKEEAGGECIGIRVRAHRLGQYTFRYQIHLVREMDVDAADVRVDAGQFAAFLDPQSDEWMRGASVDFVSSPSGSGFRIDNPAAEPHWDDPVAQKVQEVIDTAILPALAQHGGWVELLGVEGETAFVQLGGGCQGCAGAMATLRDGIAVVITREVPEITRVEDRTDHAAGRDPYSQD